MFREMYQLRIMFGRGELTYTEYLIRTQEIEERILGWKKN